MAEGILKGRIEREGGGGIRVSSAGTWGLEGEPAAKHAIDVCSERGIDLSGHVARRLSQEMIRESDLILAMEMEHLQGVLDLAPDVLGKTRMLSQYGAEETRIDKEIRDPYGRPRKAYVHCFEEIEGYVDALIEEILKG
jgi:protein-tyrosine-phosphatase